MAGTQAPRSAAPAPVRLVRERLAGVTDGIRAARWLRGEPGAVALAGDWFGGGTILLSHPLSIAAPGDDLVAVLDTAPVDRPAAAGAGEAIGGGWFGWLGFGAVDRTERLPPTEPLSRAPGALAFHDHLVRCDRHAQWWFEALWSEDRAGVLAARRAVWRGRLAGPVPAAQPYAASPLRVGGSGLAGHRAAVAEAVTRIRAGELSQVNVCLCLEAGFDGDPLDLWVALARETGAPRAAYIGPRDAHGHAVVSVSPELFLRRRGRRIETRPIKGTLPRTRPAAELLRSAKDRAENVMIVDLARNDLGRVCGYGTVTVPELCAVRPAAGVWHLESVVTGQLRPTATDSELLRATFPPGSVTGAPKVQALRVIGELEAVPRDAYCGAIGGVSPLAGLELSVAIRTAQTAGGRLWLGAGGGITADSDPGEETAEALAKAAGVAGAGGLSFAELEPTRPDPALGVFDTLLVRGGAPVALDAHLARLTASARELGLPVPDDLAARIRRTAGAAGCQAALRTALTAAGGVTIATRPLPEPGPAALVPVLVPGGLGSHKWTDRRLLDAVAAAGLTALIVDTDGTVLEAGYAAVLLVVGGELIARPCDGRTLASISRERILRAAPRAGLRAAFSAFTIADVRRADAVLLTSSLRGAHAGSLPGGAGTARAAVLAAALNRSAGW